MCGIIGYTGRSEASGILLKGLKSLEYRGYDSAGIAVFDREQSVTDTVKTKGRVEKLAQKAENIKGFTGIGHTRWATHGTVSDKNSHPHTFSRVTLVHNGIIENSEAIRDTLGVAEKLSSQTDSEVAAALIDSCFDGDPYEAIVKAVGRLNGTYAFAVMFEGFGDKIYAVRNVSPIVCCKNDDGAFIASDIIAVARYSREYFVLPELCVAEIDKNGFELKNFKGEKVIPEMLAADRDIASGGKGGYPFYMEKEISEQPERIKKTVEKRLNGLTPDFSCDSVGDGIFEGCADISVIACGTAMHAGLAGKYIIERLCSIPVNVYMASEFIYCNPIISRNTLVICVSQSGETIDTLEALKYAKSKGAKTLSIVNVRGSAIALQSENVIYTDAGPEIAVASTKAYTTQCAVFYLIAARLALVRGTLSAQGAADFVSELKRVSCAVENVISRREEIHRLAKALLSCEHTFMIGRGLDCTALLEASLKLKEISYIHSEAFASGELKHGTIALITENTPVIVLMTQTDLCSKQISNIREVESRGANVITFIKKGLETNRVSCSFELPELKDEFMLFPSVASLQLLAYYVSADKGLDVDKPRNLAKVVTVE